MASVFITGGTGFIGGATVHRLASDPRVDRLVCLVRGQSEAEARIRLARSLSRFGELPSSAASIEIVLGDLERFLAPGFPPTHVVHAAACTSLRSRRNVRRVNVEGTRALVDQLRGTSALRRFLFVGTAYGCGAVSSRIVREEDPPALEHICEYTRTKREAEEWLASAARLPLVVARPSAVVGHSELGVGPSASLFWYYRALAEAGVSPFHEDTRRDIVPVDYVAEALVHLLFAPTLKHRHYHLSAGQGAGRWGELRRALAPERDVAEKVSAEALAEHPAWAAFGDGFRRGVEACARFSALPIEQFSNERLLAEGLRPPAALGPHLARCAATSHRTVMEQMSDDS